MFHDLTDDEKAKYRAQRIRHISYEIGRLP